MNRHLRLVNDAVDVGRALAAIGGFVVACVVARRLALALEPLVAVASLANSIVFGVGVAGGNRNGSYVVGLWHGNLRFRTSNAGAIPACPCGGSRGRSPPSFEELCDSLH
jgi:hypothetical protein